MKTAATARVILPAPERPDEKWSIDFVTDSIVTGRRFHALVIVDDYSRECLVIGGGYITGRTDSGQCAGDSGGNQKTAGSYHDR